MIVSYILFGIAGVVLAALLAAKISNNLFWGILALVFFLPFERIPTVEIADFTLKLNHIFGGLLILFFFLDLLVNRRKLKPNPTMLPMLLFVVALLLSLITTTTGIRSVIFLVLDLFVILLFLIIPQVVESREKLNHVVRVILWSVAIVGLVGLYQFAGDLINLPSQLTGLDPGYSKQVFGFPRIQAFSREPLYLGNYLLIPLGVMFALVLAKVKRPGLIPIALLTLVTFILTLSRGAFMALAVAVAFVSIIAFRKIFSFRVVFWGASVLVLALLGVNVIFNRLDPELKERFLAHASIQDYREGESTQGRIHAFRRAYDAFEQSPLTGIGLGAYGMFVLNYPIDPPGGGWFIVNNQYLELLAETGIVGLATFLVLLLVILWRSLLAYLKTSDEFYQSMTLGLTGVLIGTLVQYNFFSTIAIIHIWVLMGLLVATQNLALKKVK